MYVQATVTMADWRSAEPNNTSGIAVGPDEATEDIYVLFVKGSFIVQGPAVPPEGPLAGVSPSPVTWDEGRIVFDEDGTMLNVRLWDSAKHGGDLGGGDPPIGAVYDD